MYVCVCESECVRDCSRRERVNKESTSESDLRRRREKVSVCVRRERGQGQGQRSGETDEEFSAI